MTPGTWYVAEHIFTCLLAALLLGGILGWLLYSWLRQSKWRGLEAEWTRRIEEPTGEKDQLAGQLKASTDTLTDWRTRYSTLESQLQTAEAKSAECGNKLPALEAAVADGTAKFAAWDADRANMQDGLKACADARAKLETQVADWTAKGQTWDTQRTTMAANLASAGDEKIRLQAGMAALQGEHTLLKSNFADVQSKLGPLEGLVAGWVAKSRTWDSDRNRLLEELHQATAVVEKRDAELRDLRLKLSALEQEKSRHEAGEKDLTARVNSLQAQLQKAVSDTRSGNTAEQKTIAGLRAKLASADSAHAQLTGCFASLEGEARDVTERLNTTQAQVANHEKINSDLRAGEADLNARLRTSEAQLQQVVADGKAAAAVQETTIGGLRRRITALETEHGQCAPRYAALEKIVAEKMAPAPLSMAASASASPARSGSLNHAGGDIENIEGIGPVYGGKLRKIDIYWIRELLEEGKTPAGRARIVNETGIDHRLILKWVHHADLLRIDGVTPNWAELLEVSGCETVDELHQRVPAHLQKKMEETNPTNGNGRYAPTVPDLDTISQWVEQAKQLEPKITY